MARVENDMATLRLWVETMPTWEYELVSDFELEDFIASHRSGMWTADVDAVRTLIVGDEYESGGGAMPGWKGRRIA